MNTANLNKQTNPLVLSTSSLSGDSVVNPEGEDLGDIKDFMIDMDEGSIAYAVLSFGGILGFGDKLFAIPWDSLSIDTDNERFVLDVSKEQLENAPGFDENNWPKRPTAEFVDSVYTHYGFEPYSERARTRQPMRRYDRTTLREPELA
jgi:sporulation protein YlmC with PRC-barrel domain